MYEFMAWFIFLGLLVCCADIVLERVQRWRAYRWLDRDERRFLRALRKACGH